MPRITHTATYTHVNGFVQCFSISSALAVDMLQSYTKPSIYVYRTTASPHRDPVTRICKTMWLWLRTKMLHFDWKFKHDISYSILEDWPYIARWLKFIPFFIATAIYQEVWRVTHQFYHTMNVYSIENRMLVSLDDNKILLSHWPRSFSRGMRQ